MIDIHEQYSGDYSGVLCGFTYNGIHSGTYHVDFIPDASDRWFSGADWETFETDVQWHAGGYYYGNSVNIREFSLKCFYEEVTRKQREDIRKWLHRNTSGNLIFDDMPFVYWNVRPAGIINGEEYIDSGRYSGTFTITFKAYNPFGYLTRKSNSGSENDNANDYCDLIPTSQMPAAPTTASRSFYVYNPGREACGLSLKLSGSAGKPIEFINNTNGSRCIIQGLPSGGLVLDINADTGMITAHTASSTANAELAFVYHDRGYVKLNPGTNQIQILEKNSSGSWVSPTSLALTQLEIDYAPRIL